MVLCWLDRNTCESSDTATNRTFYQEKNEKKGGPRSFIIHTSGHMLDMDLHHCFRSFPRQVCFFFTSNGRAPFAQAMWPFEAPPHDPAAFPMQLAEGSFRKASKKQTPCDLTGMRKEEINWWRWTVEPVIELIVKSSVVSYVFLGACRCIGITHFHKAKLWNGFARPHPKPF